jgi:hypothetical protein
MSLVRFRPSNKFHIFETYISVPLNHLRISPPNSTIRVHYSGFARSDYERIHNDARKSKRKHHPAGQDAPAELPKKKGGPRTPEGRRRSSLNATRHQLTSKVYIATPEESDAYNAHITVYTN